MASKTKAAEKPVVVLTFGEAFKVLNVLNEWKSLRFVDSMVAVRINSLRMFLTDQTKAASEEIQKIMEEIVEQYGTTIPGREKKKLKTDSPGVKKFYDEQKRIEEGGEIRVEGPFFKLAELRYRTRHPQTQEVSEYDMDLSGDDIDALVTPGILTLDKSE